jgi:acyl-CoA thioester hydrolase
MGIVHHSNYARWFEEARLDYMEQAGIDYHKMEKEGIIIPVLFCSCTHKKPVRFPQEFKVVVTMKQFNGLRFRVSYQVFTPENKSPAAVGESEHCFVNSKMQPIRIQKKNPELYEKMKALLDSKKEK